MWIMVEPIAEIPFGIRRSPTRCYRCNTPLPCVVGHWHLSLTFHNLARKEIELVN
jgi:hypothetical protein